MTKDKLYRYIDWDYGVDMYEVERRVRRFWNTEGKLWIAIAAGSLILPLAVGSLFILTWIYPCAMWFYLAGMLTLLLVLLLQNEKA